MTTLLLYRDDLAPGRCETPGCTHDDEELVDERAMSPAGWRGGHLPQGDGHRGDALQTMPQRRRCAAGGLEDARLPRSAHAAVNHHGGAEGDSARLAYGPSSTTNKAEIIGSLVSLLGSGGRPGCFRVLQLGF